MKLKLFIFCIFLKIFLSTQIDLRVIDWEYFYWNEKYILVDYATTQELLFSAKGRSVRSIDSVIVRLISFILAF